MFAQWRKDLAELAACPNVVVKLGGMANPRFGFGWQNQQRPPTSDQFAAATRHYFLTCIELFGPHRCMFESNYPIDKVSIAFAVLWNAYKKMTAEFSYVERAELFCGTAMRAYSLSFAI